MGVGVHARTQTAPRSEYPCVNSLPPVMSAASFQSSQTMSALDIVGLYPKYGQVNGEVWTFDIDALSRDDAVDALARLLNAMLLQALPEWQCALMEQDVQELYKAINHQRGPFNNAEISSAMMRVKLKTDE